MQWYYDRIKDKSSELEKYPGYINSESGYDTFEDIVNYI